MSLRPRYSGNKQDLLSKLQRRGNADDLKKYATYRHSVWEADLTSMVDEEDQVPKDTAFFQGVISMVRESINKEVSSCKGVVKEAQKALQKKESKARSFEEAFLSYLTPTDKENEQALKKAKSVD